jgi:hypothetical protein
MIDYLPYFWITFFLVWLGAWILKFYLNYIIYKKKQENRPFQKFEQRGFTLWMVTLFTLYNPWSKFEDSHFRKLKYRTNLFHLFHFYSVGFAVVFALIIQIAYDINHPTPTYNHRYSTKACDGDKSQAIFGIDYNAIRIEDGVIPLPEYFCFSAYSDSNTEIWKHNNPNNKPYFHQVKYVYMQDGEWLGEYDIFVHQEVGETDETLNVEVVISEGELQKKFRHDTQIITEDEFKSTLEAWGLSGDL